MLDEDLDDLAEFLRNNIEIREEIAAASTNSFNDGVLYGLQLALMGVERCKAGEL